MNPTQLTTIAIHAALLFQTGTGLAAAQPPHRVLSLDGTWQIAEGTMDRVPIAFELTWPGSLGPHVLEAELRGTDLEPVRSVRELEIIDPRSLGLAYLKSATASSVQGESYAARNAVDGDLATYWSSTFADPAWLAVDLGRGPHDQPRRDHMGDRLFEM